MRRLLLGWVGLMVGLLVLLGGTVGGQAQPEPSPSSSAAVQQAVRYFHTQQNPDGGFPYQPGGASSASSTDWVVMALRAAGENPAAAAWSPQGKTPLDYLRSQQNSLESTCDYARALLAIRNLPSETVRAGNLIEHINTRRQDNGQFGHVETGETGYINAHLWSVLALMSAGEPVPDQEAARCWLVERQNKDGGFGWAQGVESDADDTAVAVQALVALGLTSGDAAIQKALSYLRTCQESDGGFNPGWMGSSSNACTDSWVIQALLSAGEDPSGTRWSVAGRSPGQHLLSLQDESGAFYWTAKGKQTDLKCTAYAVLALLEQPFPFRYEPPAAFADLTPQHWAYDAIGKMHRQQVVAGFPDATFQPDKTVSRAEFSVMLCKATAPFDQAPRTCATFTDLTSSHWAYDAVEQAVAAGYLSGRPGGIFDPDAPIAGGELAVVLTRVMGKPVTPATAADRYDSLARALAEDDLLYPGFSSHQGVSRAQCCFSLARLVEIKP